MIMKFAIRLLVFYIIIITHIDAEKHRFKYKSFKLATHDVVEIFKGGLIEIESTDKMKQQTFKFTIIYRGPINSLESELLNGKKKETNKILNIEFTFEISIHFGLLINLGRQGFIYCFYKQSSTNLSVLGVITVEGQHFKKYCITLEELKGLTKTQLVHFQAYMNLFVCRESRRKLYIILKEEAKAKAKCPSLIKQDDISVDELMFESVDYLRFTSEELTKQNVFNTYIATSKLIRHKLNVYCKSKVMKKAKRLN
jgi:hypothetical protein